MTILLAQSSPRLVSFRVDGVARQALIYPGAGRAARTGRPLVFGFHGHGGTMESADDAFAVETRWPEATVVYPQGLPTATPVDPSGALSGWQYAPGDGGDRDLRFVDAIVASLKGVDPARIYAMGHSNGGRMVYVLWAARGDRFAAYGPSAMAATDLLSRLRPASFFATAGTRDPLVPYADQLGTIQALARLDGADLAGAPTSGYVTLATGAGGLQVGTYLFPGGHIDPPGAVAATIDLFKRTTR